MFPDAFCLGKREKSNFHSTLPHWTKFISVVAWWCQQSYSVDEYRSLFVQLAEGACVGGEKLDLQTRICRKKHGYEFRHILLLKPHNNFVTGSFRTNELQMKQSEGVSPSDFLCCGQHGCVIECDHVMLVLRCKTLQLAFLSGFQTMNSSKARCLVSTQNLPVTN